MINFTYIRNTLNLIERIKDDQVRMFVAQYRIDEMNRIREENLKILFEEAKKFHVRYLFVGKHEIAGCEDKRQPSQYGDGWPAMWAIAKNAGFPGSCGNTDQYQCLNIDIAFPQNSYGAWDLTTNTKLSAKEIGEKKFRTVINNI